MTAKKQQPAKNKYMETERDEHERMLSWMKGDMMAARFCLDFMYIIHLWDDLIDKDVTRGDEDISAAFTLLFRLPQNPFYLGHIQDLQPLIMNAIRSWHVANTFEQSRVDADLDVAYTLRCEVLNVLIKAAEIAGGEAWARAVAPDIWRTGMRQPLKQYKEELSCQT